MLLQLAMATLGVTFTGAALSMGGKKAEDPTTPPINAKSPDEENFVKCVHTTHPYLRIHIPTHLQTSMATCKYTFVCASSGFENAVVGIR